MYGTWDLTQLYKSATDPAIVKDTQKAVNAWKRFISRWVNRPDYLKKPKVLLLALDEYERLMKKYGMVDKPSYYFELRRSLDKDDPDIKAKETMISDIVTKLTNDVHFFTYNVSKIPKNEQKKFLKYKPLGKYRHFLERSFRQGKYMLSDAEERVLNVFEKTGLYNWAELTYAFLSKETREMTEDDGRIEQVPFAKIVNHLTSSRPSIRKQAQKYFYEINDKYAQIATEEMNSILEYNKNRDELKGFKRADLSNILFDDIEPEIIDTLISSISKRNDIAHRFYKLKADILGQEKIQYIERDIPVGVLDIRYSYSKAKALVLESYKNLDNEMYTLASRFFEENRVDAYPRKGKHRDPFSISVSSTLPVFILLNYGNHIDDVGTLAHELGHGINDELIKKRKNELNYGTYLSTAEVASTFFESFTLEKIAQNLSSEQQFILLMVQLNEKISNIFRQVALYRFEQEINRKYREKGYISKEEFGSIFIGFMKEYAGPAVKYEASDSNTWVHLDDIRSYFYVYSYASGYLISETLKAAVKKNPSYIECIKDFLSAGQSQSPKEIFLTLGIDITDEKFWEKGMEELETLLTICESLAVDLKKISPKGEMVQGTGFEPV